MALSLQVVRGAPASIAASRSSCTKIAVQSASGRTSRAERRQLATAAVSLRRRRTCAAAAAAAAQAGTPDDVVELKMALVDSFWGTERGLSASSDSRAEINELITQLEARNPTPEPNEARQALGGGWRLVYTSNSELIALLALGRLPLVTVGDVTQFIDPVGMTVENKVDLAAPLSKTSVTATASFEVRSPKLLQVSFEEGRVATPTLLADLVLPTSLDLLGQQIDLAPLQAALQPVEGPLRSALGALGDLLSNTPDLRIPIPSGPQSSSWLLNTYLDDTLRITRGDGGSVFILERESLYHSTATSAFSTAAVNPDWEALEERDPLATSATADVAGTTAASATVAAAVAVSAAGEATVVVVEPSAVIKASYSLGNGNSNGKVL